MDDRPVATQAPVWPTTDWSELLGVPPGSVIATEWNFFLRVVDRLVEEGHANRWVLIDGEEIIGIWDTQEDAHCEMNRRPLMHSAIVRQVLPRDPIRLSWRAQRCLK